MGLVFVFVIDAPTNRCWVWQQMAFLNWIDWHEVVRHEVALTREFHRKDNYCDENRMTLSTANMSIHHSKCKRENPSKSQGESVQSGVKKRRRNPTQYIRRPNWIRMSKSDSCMPGARKKKMEILFKSIVLQLRLAPFAYLRASVKRRLILEQSSIHKVSSPSAPLIS